MYDRAVLSANFYYWYDERVNCQRAIEKEYKKTKRWDEAESRGRTRFGCNIITEYPKAEIDGFSYHTCLCNFKHPLLDVYLELHNNLERGILPESGSLLDQTARTMEALRLIGRLKLEAQAQAQEDAKPRENKNNGRR